MTSIMDEGIRIAAEWCFTLTRYNRHTGLPIERRRSKWHKNRVVIGGRSFLAAIFVGTRTNVVPFYCALGTGTNPVEDGDEQLHAEGLRKISARKQAYGHKAYLRFFFFTGEANDNWNEVGVFVAGTEAPNSGELFNRLVSPGGINKTDDATLTVEIRIPFNAG